MCRRFELAGKESRDVAKGRRTTKAYEYIFQGIFTVLLRDPSEEFKHAFGFATENIVRRDRPPFFIPIVAVQTTFDEMRCAVAAGNKAIRGGSVSRSVVDRRTRNYPGHPDWTIEKQEFRKRR